MVAAVLVAQALLWAPTILAAVDYTWTAAGSGTGTPPGIGRRSVVPGSLADDARVIFGVANVQVLLDITPANPLDSLNFLGPATSGVNLNYGAFTQANFLTLKNGITNDPGGSSIIQVKLVLANDQTFAVSAVNGASATTIGTGGTGVSTVNLNGKTLTLSSTNNGFAIAGMNISEIFGNGVLKKIGPGTVTLHHSPAMNAPITVNAGQLSIANPTGLGSFATGPTVDAGAQLTLTCQLAGGACSYTTAVPFSLSGTGGAATFNTGALLVLADGPNTLSGTITLVPDGTNQTYIFADNPLTLSGQIVGSGGLLLKPEAPSSNITLSGASANTYTGTTSVESTQAQGGPVLLAKPGGVEAIPPGLVEVGLGSTLEIVNSEQINNGNQLILYAFRFNPINPAFISQLLLDLGVTETIGSLVDPDISTGTDQSGNVLLSTGSTLITGFDNTNTTFSGLIQPNLGGTGGLTKIGTGTFTLVGDNTYLGTTTINDGTLVVNGNQGASPVQLNSGTLAGNWDGRHLDVGRWQGGAGAGWLARDHQRRRSSPTSPGRRSRST